MKKRSVQKSVTATTIGLDLGDQTSQLCVLDCEGEVIDEFTVPTTRSAIERKFGEFSRSRVVRRYGAWLDSAAFARNQRQRRADGANAAESSQAPYYRTAVLHFLSRPVGGRPTLTWSKVFRVQLLRWFAVAFAALPGIAQRPSKDGSDAFFQKGEVHELRLVVTPEAEARLREDPRSYVPFELWVDGKRLAASAGFKLKGAAGSFRDYDDTPALTVRLDKFEGKALFHGLEKFHLNNSVQDESRLCEWLGSELFRGAGYPAVRVGHALVKINERELGLYVLKEGFDKRFLARWFGSTKGNLYDGGFCQDVDAELERDSGDGEADRRDLAALASACQASDMTLRWSSLEPLIDVASFTRFMALEELLGHWDGYTINSNNYRLYFEPGGRAMFMPHGMDQLFGEPEASVLEMPFPLLSSSVMKRPEWRKLYRKELKEQARKLDSKTLARKLEPVQARVQAALRRWNRDVATVQQERYRELLERISAREKFLEVEIAAPEPKPLVFKPGVAVTVTGWRHYSEVEDAESEDYVDDGTHWMVIRCGPSGICISGYRRGVLLERGRYRLQAQVKAEKVEPLSEENAPSRGAALRISGASTDIALTGSGTRDLQFEFEVEEEMRDVELVLELRASSGQIRLRQDSLKLVRLPSK